jgi:peptide/nickel transport system permease protein
VARYLLRRFLYLAAVLVAVTFAVSLMLSLPSGDPAQVLAGPEATPDQIEAVREALKLDRSAVERYTDWLGDALTGDLGNSLRTREPVLDAIQDRLPVTLELVILGQIVALAFAIPAAIFAAHRPGKATDTGTTIGSFLMISSPSFVVGLILIRIFSVELGWLPTGGWTPLSENVGDNLRAATLPVIALALEPAGVYQRLLRSDMRRTLDEDYIMMAEAKGLGPKAILFRHSLRPSSFSLLTMIGIISARMVGGSVVVETIFGLPGLGRLLIDSIGFRDFVTVQGVVAVIAVAYVVINSLVDVLYGVVDPRVRVDAAR